jgi:hypothetical protein
MVDPVVVQFDFHRTDNAIQPVGNYLMPKANIRPLPSSRGPFHKTECSVCGEKFHVGSDSKDFKEDILKQFDAHLYSSHRKQWDARQRKEAKRENFSQAAARIMREATEDH